MSTFPQQPPIRGTPAHIGAHPRCHRAYYPPGACILRRGDRAGQCAVILSGTVNVVDAPATRYAKYTDMNQLDEEIPSDNGPPPPVICTFSAPPAKLVGESALLTSKPLSASVVVAGGAYEGDEEQELEYEGCECVIFDRFAFRTILSADVRGQIAVRSAHRLHSGALASVRPDRHRSMRRLNKMKRTIPIPGTASIGGGAICVTGPVQDCQDGTYVTRLGVTRPTTNSDLLPETFLLHVHHIPQATAKAGGVEGATAGSSGGVTRGPERVGVCGPVTVTIRTREEEDLIQQLRDLRAKTAQRRQTQMISQQQRQMV